MSYQFADIYGIKLHYDVQGQGDALVLIHAAIANQDQWDPQMAVFSPHYKVIRYDVRGFGETPDPPGKYTDHEDLKALLDQLGVKRTSLVGNSNGGRIALDFTLTYPEMVEKLVLVAPGIGGYRGSVEDPFQDEMYAKYHQAMEVGDLDQAAEITTQIWVDGPNRKAEQLDPEFRKRAKALVRYAIETNQGEGEGDIARPPAAERLGEVKVPTLLILGEGDVKEMFAVAEALQAGIPQLKRGEIAGTAHLPSLEKPDEFNRIVLDFLQEH